MVATDIVVDEPEVTDEAAKLTVTPAGAPVADKATDCELPDTVVVRTVAEALDPAVTVADVADSVSEKSLVTGAFTFKL